jgi:hypothetical protein
MSFGRKGLAPGEIAPVAPRPAAPVASQDDAMAARREAFLASERSRKTGAADAVTASPDNSSDPLAGLRNGVRPAMRRDASAGQSWSPMPEKDVRAAMQSRSSAGAARRSSGQRWILGEPSKRSLGLAYLFWFVAGQGSLHRFYCGQKETALMQIGLGIVSLVVMFIFPPLGFIGLLAWIVWIFADLFLMPGMMRRFKAEHRVDYGDVFA